MNIEILKNAGIDYENGVKRFIGDSALYEELLVCFLESTSLERAKIAFENKDIEQIMQIAHEVKGVSGNMDMTRLYKAACELVDLIRSKDYDDTSLTALYEIFKKAYEDVLTAIASASGDNGQG